MYTMNMFQLTYLILSIGITACETFNLYLDILKYGKGAKRNGMEWRVNSIVWVFYNGKKEVLPSAQIGGEKYGGNQ